MGHATVMANVEFFCKTGQIQTNEEDPDMLKMDKLKLNSGNKKEGEVGNTKRDILNINISLFSSSFCCLQTSLTAAKTTDTWTPYHCTLLQSSLYLSLRSQSSPLWEA